MEMELESFVRLMLAGSGLYASSPEAAESAIQYIVSSIKKREAERKLPCVCGGKGYFEYPSRYTKRDQDTKFFKTPCANCNPKEP